MTRNATQIPSALNAYIKAARRAGVRFDLVGHVVQLMRGRNAYPTCEAEQKRTDQPANDTAHTAPEASVASLAKLARRKEPKKIALNTYITPRGHKRLEWLKDRDFAVTDIVEEALRRYFDQVGVPDDDAIGEQRTTGISQENQPLDRAATP